MNSMNYGLDKHTYIILFGIIIIGKVYYSAIIYVYLTLDRHDEYSV